jgi:hypothetical protein
MDMYEKGTGYYIVPMGTMWCSTQKRVLWVLYAAEMGSNIG